MKDFKEIIAGKIAEATNLPKEKIIANVEVPKDTSNGDYAFPCFRLAKNLKKAPQMIANDIKEKIEIDDKVIEKVEIAGGYLNFYINKELMIEEVLKEIENKEEYGKSVIGNGKNIVIDYSAPNIAKPFHIGHLRSTVIGGALYNIYKYLGYNVTGINHLGDYGTQFGKLIEGYKLWGNEYNIDENPIEELTKIYIRINNLCKEDENVLNACRDNFKKLEDKDPYCVELWEKFRTVSLKEFQKVYDLLGSNFDSWNGEAFYSDKMQEVMDILDKTGKLVESQGAKIIDLEEVGISTPCIIQKSNGSTTYATRDLAAILYRARNYDFDKALYVVSYEQNLHFRQIFEVAKLLGIDKKYTDGLKHVQFGMVSLPSGKMSTREGNVIKVEDLLKESIARVKQIIKEKNPEMENLEENARKIGIGAVIFNNVATTIIKDQIFDWDTILNFNGETGPYIQYTYVRTNSVLNNSNGVKDVKKIDFSVLTDKESLEVVKKIYEFNNVIENSVDKNEPSLLARYLLELAKNYSTFYNNNKILVEDEKTKDARVFLTYSVGIVLKIGMKLLGIEMPDKM